jgi:hypothetical protein
MSLDQTKAYVLTAASSSISDLMTAIYDHFNTAPGLWRLKPGTSSSAQGVVIEPKTPVSGYNIGVSIRRNSNTNFQLALDPLNAYTAAGNASVGPVGGSSEASGDITLAITGIASAKIALIETPDAIAALFSTAVSPPARRRCTSAACLTPSSRSCAVSRCSPTASRCWPARRR